MVESVLARATSLVPPGCGTKIPHAWERSQKIFLKGVGWGREGSEHFLSHAPVLGLLPHTPPPPPLRGCGGAGRGLSVLMEKFPASLQP